jgi:sulfur transfer complex TusBCD TusB component (DsrH family)
MRVLNIVESAYRATLEEQDDTVVWLTHAMKGAGADLGVLLRSNAVNYAVRGQDASGLRFGAAVQTQPPRLAEDLGSLLKKAVSVYVLEEDLTDRGIQSASLIDGLERIKRRDLPALFGRYDQVWHW